jgi:hypothetical protein
MESVFGAICRNILNASRIRVIEGTIELVLISLPHVLIPRQISK